MNKLVTMLNKQVLLRQSVADMIFGAVVLYLETIQKKHSTFVVMMS